MTATRTGLGVPLGVSGGGGGGGGGDTVSVNGGATASTNVDLDDATPAAPAGAVNVKFQKDALSPTNVSASVQGSTAAQKGVVELATQGEVDTGTDTDRAITPATLAGTSQTFAPATHGGDHVSTGSDAIPAVVAAGASGLMTGGDKTKIDGVEALADVTDAANVAAAGALTAAGITTVDATALATETSTTYAAIADMNVTPGAGDFLVWFSAMILGDADDEQMVFGVHVDGILADTSERDLPKGTNKDKNDTAIGIHAKVSGVGAGEVVDVRWKQPSGAQTMQITNRTLTVIKV